MTQRTLVGCCLIGGLSSVMVLGSLFMPHAPESSRLRTASAQGTSAPPGDASQDEASQLRQQLETLQVSLTQARQEAQQATLAATEAQQRLQRLEADLQQQQSAFQTEQRARTTQEAALAHLKQTLDQAQQALAAARQESAQTQQQLSTAQQQLAQTTARVAEAEHRLQVTEAELGKERTTLAEAQKVSAAQRAQLGQLQQMLDTERQALASTRQDLGRVQHTLEAARAEGRQAQAAHQEEATQLRQALQHEQQVHMASRQTLTTVQLALDEARQQRQVLQQQQAQGPARRQALAEKITTHLGDTLQRQKITLSQGPDYVGLHVPYEALFVGQGVTLRPEAQAFLNQLAPLLQSFVDHPIRVEGHADSVPIRRVYRQQWPTNWELSAARAAAVARALMRKGLATARVMIGGYGASRPMAPNETPVGRAQNRRLDVLVQVPAAF